MTYRFLPPSPNSFHYTQRLKKLKFYLIKLLFVLVFIVSVEIYVVEGGVLRRLVLLATVMKEISMAATDFRIYV